MSDFTFNISGGGPLDGSAAMTTVIAMNPNDTTITTTPPIIEIPEELEDLRARMPKPSKAKARRDWYRMAAGTDSADIYIYDEITDPFMSDLFGIGISAASFVRDLQDLKGQPLNVHINSPGGSVFEGLAIYNSLRQHDAPVHVIVDGIAASIASVIAMAGTTVTMAPHSMLMIHDAWGITMGNAADHEQQARVLNKLSDDIAAVYRERGDSRINWRAKMKDETWLLDSEAVSMGLADRVDSSVPSAQANFDLSRFRNAPEHLVLSVEELDRAPTKRAVEDALRDAGLSAREAKAFVSIGWKALEVRDEPDDASTLDETKPEGEETTDEPTGTVEESVDVRGKESRIRELAMMELLLAS